MEAEHWFLSVSTAFQNRAHDKSRAVARDYNSNGKKSLRCQRSSTNGAQNEFRESLSPTFLLLCVKAIASSQSFYKYILHLFVNI